MHTKALKKYQIYQQRNFYCQSLCTVLKTQGCNNFADTTQNKVSNGIKYHRRLLFNITY